MDLSHLDDDTARFVLKLHIEDVQQLIASYHASHHKEGETSERKTPDGLVSAQVLLSELTAMQRRLDQQVMCRSMACAFRTDARIIQTLEAQAQQEAADRRMALQLGGMTNAAPFAAPGAKAAGQSSNQGLVPATSRPTSLPKPQPTPKPTPKPMPAPTSICTACSERFPDTNLLSAPCAHKYCATCARDLCRGVMADETLFPARCCRQPIPIVPNTAILGADLVRAYEAKRVEYETLDRTYCSAPACSEFIPPAKWILGKYATCPKCKAHTCTGCKAKYHHGLCTEKDDPGITQLLDLAKKKGWQRCKKCSRVVELGIGCYHMTCLCKAEFCYLCNAKWKTCRCAQWDEQRLLERAQEVAARDNQQRTAQQRAALVPALQRHIAANHDCTHRNWNRREGMGQCERCHDEMPTYTYVCARCAVMACRRCRFNRF